jgi:hypothetical protein
MRLLAIAVLDAAGAIGLAARLIEAGHRRLERDTAGRLALL